MKVLLIGSSFSAIPFLFDLHKRGADVTVIGKYEQDPCHAYVESSIFEDYSDREKFLEICKKGQFDYIVPSCNDYSYLSGAYVAAQLGFVGFDDLDVTEILHTKNRFRQFCASVDVPFPKIYGEVSKEASGGMADLALRGPALVKPVDSFSGRGVQKIHDAADLPAAIQCAFEMSRSGQAVVEEFVEGSLHSHTCFIADGSIIWHDFIDEFCDVYPYQVDRSHFPSRLSREQRKAVHECMGKIVSALKLCDGLLHTQFIATEDEFWIIECMRRCPGDLYGHHFQLALGYDYESQFVGGFVGQKPVPPPASAPAYTRIERRIVSVDRETPFRGVELQASGRSVFYVPLKDSGHKLHPAPFDKAGIAFFAGEAISHCGNVASSATGVWQYT